MRWAASCAPPARGQRESSTSPSMETRCKRTTAGRSVAGPSRNTSLCRRPIQLSSDHHATVRYWDPTLQRYQARTVVLPKFEGDEGTDAIGQKYSITGTKIFISCGEHDLTDNIVHCVLARLPDAPEGTKGISQGKTGLSARTERC